MKPLILWLAFGGFLGLALVLSGCGNMKDQPNPRTLATAPQFPDGTASRPRPAHTLAHGQPAPDTPFETGLLHDGTALARSPVAFTPELLARGRDRFNIYCAVCHGEDGYGTGIVVRRGFPPPPSYHDDRLRQSPDGHLFDVITRGYGVMPSLGDRVPAHDRWAIVGYIRALQRSQRATLADVPAPDRATLAAP